MAAHAQEALQLNVPYQCPDGTTNTVTRCERNARGVEVCFWREDKNGQLIGERYNVRAQMDGWLAICKVKPAPQPAAVSNPPRSQAALNPPYLAGFPSVNTVKGAIKGSNPADMLARQVAVLNGLPRVILRMQMVPGRPYNSATTDERQMSNAYTLAAYELSQGYLKSASPEAARAFEQMTARYSLDSDLSGQMYGLLSPATRAEFTRIDAAATAQAASRIEQQRRETEQARVLPAQPVAGTAMRNDPGTLAVRRCLELGGGEFECIGQGFATGLGITDVMSEFAPAVPRGVRVGGTYQTSAGLTIGFESDAATISACGKLEPEKRAYSVTRKGDQLLVEIQTEPRPLGVTLNAAGVITGPASFDLAGRVITGYRTYWVEERYLADNTLVPGSGRQVSEPIYEPRTERCAFPSLRASAPVQAPSSMIGAVVGIFNGQQNPAAQRSDTAEAPAGPRMSGKYASAGGLQLEFHPTAVVMDCGEAHVLRPYTVQNLTDRLVVTVRNGNIPVPLSLRPDGVLTGSGTIDVVGRVVTGTNADGVTYAPRTARCNVDALSPK